MSCPSPSTLSDGVVCLRPFREADAEAMYRTWASDPEVTRYLTWEPHRDVSETRGIIAGWMADDAAASDTPTWAITLVGPVGAGEPAGPVGAAEPVGPVGAVGAGGEPIGSISIVAWDGAHEVCEVGYCIGRPRWHRGITSRALALLLGECFTRRGAQAVEAIHDVRNPRSGLVMQRCGMARASETPEPCEVRGVTCEMLRYRIDRATWTAAAHG